MAIRVCLDPGHGQYENKSPNNSKYIEGTQMWKLSQFLMTELEEYGIEVLTTRPKISDNPSLESRGELAGKNNCNLFLSLHSNAPGPNADGSYDKTCTGTTCFYSMTRPETKTLSDELGQKVSSLMGHYFRGSMTMQYPGKPGVDYYGVIRNAAQSGCKCAMIIEHGFHTSVADSAWLLSDANLQRLANAEAAIIADYFGCVKISQRPAAAATSGAIYRVQVGAFSNKDNAEAMLKLLRDAGFDGFVVADQKTDIQAAAPTPSVVKSVDEVAREVIQGKWGAGEDRQSRLMAAGYAPAEIQARVNELMLDLI